jgi:hypothetical protein
MFVDGAGCCCPGGILGIRGKADTLDLVEDGSEGLSVVADLVLPRFSSLALTRGKSEYLDSVEVGMEAVPVEELDPDSLCSFSFLSSSTNSSECLWKPSSS